MARRPEDNDRINEAAAQASNMIRARKQAQASDAARIRSQAQASDAARARSQVQASDLVRVRKRAQEADSRGHTERPQVDFGRSQGQARFGSHAKKPQRTSLFDFVRRNCGYILSVLGVAVIVVLLLVFLRSHAPSFDGGGSDQADMSPDSYVTAFDWGNLDRTNGRYAYIENGVVRSSLGIDVSENQQEIDWQAVAADGIDFAMVRLGYRGATEGDLYEDAWFRANVDGAHAAGVDCGVYFFSQAISPEEAIEEAEFVLARLDGVTVDYPIAYDSELGIADVEYSRTSDLDQDQMTAVANAFCERIEAAGYRSMIYGNGYDLARYNYDSLVDRRIWWAEYDAPVPSHVMDIVMWQYTNDGVVAGIETGVDMNIDVSGIGV